MAMQPISSQVTLPLRKAVDLATKSLRKRFARSLITMTSVILAMAFLSSIWIGNAIVNGLRELGDPKILTLLMKNGVDPVASGISSKMLWLISLSLLVCAVGIMNAMLMNVTERFKEIGTMKCLGALDMFIIKIFMIEAAIQGAVGTLIGIILGLVIGFGSGLITYGPIAVTEVAVGELLFALLVSFVIGVVLSTVFAIYPAHVAASMQPVEAMRVEE